MGKHFNNVPSVTQCQNDTRILQLLVIWNWYSDSISFNFWRKMKCMFHKKGGQATLVPQEDLLITHWGLSSPTVDTLCKQLAYHWICTNNPELASQLGQNVFSSSETRHHIIVSHYQVCHMMIFRQDDLVLGILGQQGTTQTSSDSQHTIDEDRV